jgi:hypothetical protein
MLKFWPADPATRAEIGALLARMVPSREALDWLVGTLIDQVGDWPGPAEVRGILCWHYKPADGIERSCSLVGFRPEDGERRSYDAHLALKAGGNPEITRELVKAREWPR